jgi:hypothetical protein
MHSNLYKTKLTVRTQTPDVTHFTTSADEARIILISNSSNFALNEPNKNHIFYIGTTTSNKEAYIGIDDNYTKTINKIATFNQSEIKFNLPTTIKGDLLPAVDSQYDLGSVEYPWCNLYLSGCNLYFNETLIHYDKTSNELQFYKERLVLDYASNMLAVSNIIISSNYTEPADVLVYSNVLRTSNYEASVSILLNTIDVTYTDTALIPDLLAIEEGSSVLKSLKTSNISVAFNLMTGSMNYDTSNVVTSSNYLQYFSSNYTSNMLYTSNEPRTDIKVQTIDVSSGYTEVQIADLLDTSEFPATEYESTLAIFQTSNYQLYDDQLENYNTIYTSNVILTTTSNFTIPIDYYKDTLVSSNYTVSGVQVIDTSNVTDLVTSPDYFNILQTLLSTIGLESYISKALITSNYTIVYYTPSTSNITTSNIHVTSNEMQLFTVLKPTNILMTSDIVVDIDGVPTTITVPVTSNVIFTKHAIASNIDVTYITDKQLVADLLFYDISILLPDSFPPTPEISKDLSTSNLLIITEFYRKLYEYVPIVGKHMSVRNADGSLAFFETSSLGTFLESQSVEGDTISRLNLTNFSTDIIPEDTNLYYTEQRALDIINTLNTESSMAITNTSNDIATLARENYITFTTSAKSIEDETAAAMVALTDTLQSNVTYDTLELLQLVESTSNELSSNLMIIFHDVMSNLLVVDRESSNYMESVSNQLLMAIRDTSNIIITTLSTNDKSFRDYVINTSNIMNSTRMATSNFVVEYIKQTDIATSNRIDQTSNELRLEIVKVYDDLIQQSRDSDSSSYNILMTTSNELHRNITNTFNTIQIDITTRDLVMSNYISDIASNISSNISVMSKAISDRIHSLTLNDIANGERNKVIVDNVYPYDLTVSNLTIVGDLLPDEDSKYDLGTPEKRWKDLYLSGNTIYMDNIKLSSSSTTTGLVVSKQNPGQPDSFADLVVSKIVLYDSVDKVLKEIKSENRTVTVAAYNPNSVSGGTGGTGDSGGTTLKKQDTTANIIEGTSNLYFTYARVGAIAAASNVFLKNYTDSVSNLISRRINNLNADQIANGTSNRFIVNGVYDNDLTINATLTVSNLNVIGSTTSISTISYTTERMLIDTRQTDGPAIRAIQLGTCNLAEFYVKDSNVFTITAEGLVGIGSSAPKAELDVVGNIRFSGSINDITATVVNHLQGLKAPVQGQINSINMNTSNLTSNMNIILRKAHDDTSNQISLAITSSNTLLVHYVHASSNAFASNMSLSSNNIKSLISDLGTRISSNVMNNVSNVFNASIPKMYDDINNRITALNTDMNRYVLNTSNALQSNITLVATRTDGRITDITTTGWILGSGNSNIYFANNVGIGTNTPTTNLDVVGNIRFSGSINRITSNEFRHLRGVTSRVQTQIDSTRLNLNNYTSNTSNTFENLFSTTSNTIMTRLVGLNNSIYDYVRTTSNAFEASITTTSNNLSRDINRYLSTGRLSQWTTVNKNTSNEFIFFANDVAIGSTTLTDPVANRLEVYGGDILIVNGLMTRTQGTITEPYQFERWLDSTTYLTGAKFIYYNNGYVGIGTTPNAPLHVASGSDTMTSPTYVEYTGSLSGTLTGSVSGLCAVFDSSIWCKQNVAVTSDERIKKNMEDINDDSALQKIMSIEPKTYNYIDNKRGVDKVYGFIAQQIREVIPEAVQLRKDVVPNIFTVADCAHNLITFNPASNIDTSMYYNSNICIIDLSGNYGTYNVNSVQPENHSMTIDRGIQGNKVFVYGCEVDDFHILDKSYIFTLNVCATQELSRQLDDITQQVEQLESILHISPTDYMSIL